MDYLKKFTDKDNTETPSNGVATEASSATTKPGEGHGSGGIMDSINSALGGGAKSEQKEDGLDKTIDWVQEHILGQGPQTNESAVEQAKDEAISDTVRAQFKKVTGHEFPVADK